MTVPTALLLSALAGGAGEPAAVPELASVPGYPPPLTGLVASPPAPLVRAQSPPPPGGWTPAVPVSPGPPGPLYTPRPAPLDPLGPAYGSPPAPAVSDSFGVNGPQPFDFAPELRLDAGHLFDAAAEGRAGGLAVTEVDAIYEIDVPVGAGVFTAAPEYRLRALHGPPSGVGGPPLPGNLHRLGVDLALTSPRLGPWSATVGVTPSINTDFADSLTDDGRQLDGRAAVFFQAAPNVTLVGGVKYLDRVDDIVLPWAGAVWRPGDRWEVRAVFPDPRVEYFWGPVWGKPMWVYGGFEFRRESWQFSPETAGPPETDAVQFTDWRFILGARKEQGWGRTFLEAGVVFDRDVAFEERTGADFEVGEALILRGGVRF